MEAPRVAAVEGNLDALLESLIRSGEFETESDPDVSSYWSDVPFPVALRASGFVQVCITPEFVWMPPDETLEEAPESLV